MVGKALSGNDMLIAYIAPTYQQARDIAWQMLKKVCLPISVKVNESRLEIEVKTIHSGTSTITLRGWENIDTLRGQACDFIVIDEVASMRNFLINYEEIVRPTLTDRKGSVLFISTPKGFNHWYDLYNKQDVDYESFTFTSYDNPYLDKAELDKARKEIPEYRFAQEYLADFKKIEGLVYNLSNLHIIKERELKNEITIGGIDWGWTNPAAIIIVRYTDGCFYIVDEWYQTGKTTNQIIEQAKLMQEKWHVNRWYADSANPEKIAEANTGTGLYVIGFEKLKDSISNGISYINQLLLENRLLVYNTCVETISEFNSYKYDDLKPKEIPIPENDHLMDCLRYAVYGYKPVIRYPKLPQTSLERLLNNPTMQKNNSTNYE